MKMADVAVKNPGSLRWNAVTKRYAVAGASTGTSKRKGKEESDNDDAEEEDAEALDPMLVDGGQALGGIPLPTKPNPVIVTIYGQVCIAAKSYQSAICECYGTLGKIWF